MFDELEELKPIYFNETDTEKKQEYKKQIDKLIKQITNNDEHFDFEVYFSEVFHEKKGFDVVIGNPPYISAVEHSKIEDKMRKIYRNRYPLLKGAFDIYTIFLIKGINISNVDGKYSWIIPNKFLVSRYAENVLEHLKQNGLNSIIDVSKYGVFDDTAVYPVVLIGNKKSDSFTIYDITSLIDLEQDNLIIRTQLREFKTFKDYNIRIASGTTGFQAQQIIPFLSEEKKKNSIPFIVSGSIDKYYINFCNVHYMRNVYRKAFIKKGNTIAESKWEFWMREKIIIAGMTKEIEATYSKIPLALGVGVYAIYNYGNFNPKFLLAVLNSKYLSYYLNIKFKDKHLAGGYLAINKSTIEKLPLVEIPFENQTPFIDLVNNILAITKDEDYLDNPIKQAKVKEYENKIDKMVYKLYGLTEEEINIVEGATNK